MAGLCAAVMAAAAVAANQPAPSDTQPRPTFRTEANYIRVDAFVTRDGVPVTDLTSADFELLEDGTPQTINAFEYVRIRPAGPQVARVEPRSQQEAQQMAAEGRARVFVLFLDIDQVPVEGSHRVRTEVNRLIDRIVGPDDFIGMITSRHSPSDLILARKTALLQEQLEKYWYWGRRDTITRTPEEEEYWRCFVGYIGGEEIAEEMIDRRREKMTMDALSDLVVHLRGLREERKAVLTLTAGWRLFRPNAALTRALTTVDGQTHVPGPPPVGVGPGGKLMSGDDPRSLDRMTYCDQHRQLLAHLDNERDFRDLLEDANRANVSFYPIDPRGLVVFDTPIGARRPVSLADDLQLLRTRQHALRQMADQTDGMAVINQNDLEPGLRRIADDLSSYYLIGYYASNQNLDGRYRRITVRVKRPGVQVRARRGYRAATPEEFSRATPSADPADGAAAAVDSAVTTALGRLSLIRPAAEIYVHASHHAGGALWVNGELASGTARAVAWAQGGRVSIMALDEKGNTIGAGRQDIKAGERDFAVSVALDDANQAPSRVMVRAEPSAGTPIGVEVAPERGEPLLFRRQAASPPRAAADFRFFRTEDLVYRWPGGSDDQPDGARVLDRNGQPMALTVSSEVEERQGRWITGFVRLAPLTQGDYVLELTRTRQGETDRVLVPFKVVR